eukprot:UN24799
MIHVRVHVPRHVEIEIEIETIEIIEIIVIEKEIEGENIAFLQVDGVVQTEIVIDAIEEIVLGQEDENEGVILDLQIVDEVEGAIVHEVTNDHKAEIVEEIDEVPIEIMIIIIVEGEADREVDEVIIAVVVVIVVNVAEIAILLEKGNEILS